MNKDKDEKKETVGKAKLLLLGYKFKPIPEYGDLFTLEEFIKNVEEGGFVNYDDTGRYAFKDETCNKEVRPSDVKRGNIDRNFTHVIWFNR